MKKVKVKTKDGQILIGKIMDLDSEVVCSFFDLPFNVASENFKQGIWLQHANKLSFISHDHIVSMENV